MRRDLVVAFMAGVMLGGCTSAKLDQPPRIRYGEEACHACQMLISEARFAAALTTTRGEAQHFDEIGCLLYALAQQTETPASVWVHDYQTDAWLDAASAFFVRSRELTTPMGGGIVAVASEEAATRLSRDAHGQVVRFDQLLKGGTS